MKKVYQVKIYEQPYVYEIEAETKEEAESIAVNRHNCAQWDEISKVVITEKK